MPFTRPPDLSDVQSYSIVLLTDHRLHNDISKGWKMDFLRTNPCLMSYRPGKACLKIDNLRIFTIMCIVPPVCSLQAIQ